MTSDAFEIRKEKYRAMCQRMSRADYLDGDKKAKEEVAKLRDELEQADIARLSPRQAMRAEIELQIEREEGNAPD
jgi:hypothetical protein